MFVGGVEAAGACSWNCAGIGREGWKADWKGDGRLYEYYAMIRHLAQET